MEQIMGVEQITVVDSVWYYWVLFVIAAITGGTASSLINNSGKVLMCGWQGGNPSGEEGNPGKYCMGIISDIIIGIAAALAILWTLTPQNPLQLIGLGAVAGYGGSSVLRAMVNKLEGEHAQQEADKSRKEAEKNKDEAEINKSLDEAANLMFDGVDDNITAIKNYLLKNNKQVLIDLYNNKLIN